MFINMLQLTFPFYMLAIFDRVLSSNSLQTLFAITVAAILAMVIGSLLEFTRSRLLVRCGIAIDQALGRTVLDTVIKKAAFSGVDPQQATLRDVGLLRNFFAGATIFSLFDIPWTPIFLAATYILHPLIGHISLAGVVLMIIFAILNEVLTRRPINEANHVNNISMNLVETARRNAQTVYGMGMLNDVARFWDRFNNVTANLQTRASRRAGLMQCLSSFLRQSMQVFVYGIGAYLTVQHEATAGIMIAGSIIMGKAMAPVQSSITVWKSMIEARAAWRRLDSLFSAPETPPGMDLPPPTGLLGVEQANFVIRDTIILRGINFTLMPGESMGLIGPSGAGKSTLCRLLLGLWPPASGRVRLDGHDLFSWDKQKIGPYLGYLPQEVELFNGTLADNIARLGLVDSEKVIAAAEHAGVHQLVLSFPQGYDTRVGEHGVVLSAGQRQRIGLARALYGNPKLVILDEPNSNLDSEGEAALVRSFRHMKEQGATLIVVSHKPSLLASMDKILVLNQGQMALFGPREAVFQQLVAAQQPSVKSAG